MSDIRNDAQFYMEDLERDEMMVRLHLLMDAAAIRARVANGEEYSVYDDFEQDFVRDAVRKLNAWFNHNVSPTNDDLDDLALITQAMRFAIVRGASACDDWHGSTSLEVCLDDVYIDYADETTYAAYEQARKLKSNEGAGT